MRNTEAAETPLINNGQRQVREWFFGIPLQVGPPTVYARSVNYWLLRILFLQVIGCIIRVAVMKDVSGGLWMAVAASVGAYAYRQDMNITYVCCWGLLCLLNALFDVVAVIWTLSLGGDMVASDTLVMIYVPIVYLLGALFARHLYLDYCRQENITPLAKADVFAKVAGPNQGAATTYQGNGAGAPPAAAAQPGGSTAMRDLSALGSSFFSSMTGSASKGAAGVATYGTYTANAANDAAARGEAVASEMRQGQPGAADVEAPEKMEAVSTNPFMTGPLHTDQLPGGR